MTLQQNRFFSGFSEAVTAELARLAQIETHDDAHVLFCEGAESGCVYLVLEGSVEIIRMPDESSCIVLATVEPGEYFGEVGLFDQRRTTGARTRGATKLATIPRDAVIQVLQREPFEVTQQFLNRIIGYLRGSNDRVLAEVVHKEKMHFIGEMASSIIHDFKNPMASILLASDSIAMLVKEPEVKRLCDLICMQTDRMVNMARELLEFSSGKPNLQREPVNIRDVLLQFQMLNADFIKSKGVQLILRPPDCVACVDAKRLMRVLQNLVSNAVDALRDRPNGVVQCGGRVADGWLQLSVADNGPGIPEHIRDKIFQPFVTFGKTHGTGLGMAIVKMIVEAHGGTVQFETETGKGTCFWVSLPLG